MTELAGIDASGGARSGARRRVAVVGPFPPIRSGIARHTAALSAALEKRSDLVVSRWGFSRQYPAWLYPGASERDPGAPADPKEEPIDGANPLSWRRTARGIARWSPDLLVMPAWTFAAAPALGHIARDIRRHGSECTMVVHNAFDHEAAWWKDRLTRWQLGAAARFVTHNKGLADALKDRLPKTPVGVFPHPVFDDLPRATGALPRRGGLELLFFGLVRPYKGLDVLLDAMGRVGSDDVRLTIAGEFWSGLDETRAEIARRGLEDRIELVPRFVSDAEAAEMFHRADAVVMPYRAVSGSGVVSAALHHGRAVIASDLPGFAEVIRDGETGWLFPSGDAAALARRIGSLTRAETIAASAAAQALGRSLTWDRFADVVLGDGR